MNFHYSVTLDLYGADISSNAANFYTGGLKGRYGETNINDDHALSGDSCGVQELKNGEIVTKQVPALTALSFREFADSARD